MIRNFKKSVAKVLHRWANRLDPIPDEAIEWFDGQLDGIEDVHSERDNYFKAILETYAIMYGINLEKLKDIEIEVKEVRL